MLKDIFGRFQKLKQAMADAFPFAQLSKRSTYDSIFKMLSPSGRVAFATLSKISQDSAKKDFIQFLQKPTLVGSAIHRETLLLADRADGDPVDKTQMINLNDFPGGRPGPGASLPYAIYPLVKRSSADSPPDTFKIGRHKINDLIMQDIAISKEHAVIRVTDGIYFIEDCGSTNGTWLNGKRLENIPLQLSDKDTIGLGQYEFTFMLPSSLYDLLRRH